MNITDFQDIIYTKAEDTGIVTISINRPETKNSMSFYTFWELCQAVEAVKSDNTAKAIILTGGRNPDSDDPQKEVFSSGGYLNTRIGQIGAPDSPPPQEALSEIDPLDFAQKRLSIKFFELDKPVVAALNGYAIGAGFTLPLVGADLIYASEHAWIQMPFVRIGVLPEFASSYILPRMIGLQKAKEIFYFGKKLQARELLDLGLINGVLPHNDLIPYVIKQTLELISPHGPGLAVRFAKQAIHAPLIERMRLSLDKENLLFEKAYGSSDFKEFIASRTEKRMPVFKNC